MSEWTWPVSPEVDPEPRARRAPFQLGVVTALIAVVALLFDAKTINRGLNRLEGATSTQLEAEAVVVGDMAD